MTLPTRRSFLASGGAIALLAACQSEPEPNILTVVARAQPGMNPSGGSDVPVQVQVFQLRSASAFEAADYITLQSDPSILGADLLRADRLILAPGGTADLVAPVMDGAGVIGVTAGFRDPSGRTVRQTVPAPAASSSLTITVGPSGLSLATA